MVFCIDPKTESKNIGLPQDVLFENSFNRHPKKGKCPKSTMLCGWHRVGLIPIASSLDGGAPGDYCQEICIDCGKRFFGLNSTGFVLKDQPRSIGGKP